MLVPIAVLAYFRDIPGWVSTLYAAHMLGFVAAAAVIFVLGLWLKRGIVGSYLEMSQGSTILGLLFAFVAIAFYIYGSWYGLTSWLHFESLFFLAVAYGFFTLDARFMSLAAPLLVTFAFILPLPFLNVAIFGQPALLFYVPAVLVGLFAFYVGARPKPMALPTLIVAAGTLYWLYPAWELAFAPLLCLVLLAPKGLRLQEQLTNGASGPCMLHGEQETLMWGFCSMCGRKRATIRQGHLGVVGLAVVVLAVYALAVTQVPVLSLNAGVPTSNIYSPESVTSTPIPPVPAGWLVNSSTILNAKGDAYAVKQVYVPSYHPETENYTLYYEVSLGVTPITSSWRAMPGWNQSSSVSSILPIQGRLITYVSPQAILMVFVGTDQMFFSNGTAFEPLYVGMSVTREFHGTTVADATSEFTSDLQALFSPMLESETYYSGWTGYFFRVSQTATEVEGLLALVSSAGLIFWSAYRVELSDSRRDGFVTEASGVDDEDYSLLAAQLEAGRSKRTGNQIAGLAGVGQEDEQSLLRIYHSLQNLESKGLIRRVLVETGADLSLEWKVAV